MYSGEISFLEQLYVFPEVSNCLLILFGFVLLEPLSGSVCSGKQDDRMGRTRVSSRETLGRRGGWSRVRGKSLRTNGPPRGAGGRLFLRCWAEA